MLFDRGYRVGYIPKSTTGQDAGKSRFRCAPFSPRKWAINSEKYYEQAGRVIAGAEIAFPKLDPLYRLFLENNSVPVAHYQL